MKKFFIFLVFFGITFIIAQKVPGGSSSPCIVGPDNLALNQTGIYSVSSALAQCTQCHDWDIDGLNVDVSSNAQITTDERLNTVSIKRIGTGSITIKVTYFTEEGFKECIKVLPACCGGTGSVTCNAVIDSIWGVPVVNLNYPQFNVEINVDVFCTNPFSNLASALIQWNPVSMNGSQVAGGLYNLATNQTALLPSQYLTVGSPNSPSGYYSPMIVRYTDLVTGQVCTVNLNPLVFNGTHHMRTSNIINISPNPAKSTINIEGENLENLYISILS